MAENFRRGDRVEWHDSPRITTDSPDFKRAKAEHDSVREHGAADDGGEGSIPTGPSVEPVTARGEGPLALHCRAGA